MNLTESEFFQYVICSDAFIVELAQAVVDAGAVPLLVLCIQVWNKFDSSFICVMYVL